MASASFSAFKGAETDLFFLKKEIVAIQTWSELSAAFSNMAALGNRETSTVGFQAV